jgi:hypothetical protein
MKQIKLKKVVIMTIVSVSALVGAHRVSAASVLYDAPACSIATQPGDILIDFDHSTRILSRPDAFHAYSRSANIPAGDYKITLESFDGYLSRVSTSPIQKREQYYVQFMNGSNQIARSAATSDLRDGVERAYFKGTVNDKLTIGSQVSSVTVMHAAWPDNTTANSLVASCLVLHPLGVALDGQCGTADGKTFSEKPTANLCVNGSVSSVSGSGPWSWTCNGSNGGTNATCQATRAIAPTDAACGTRSTSYSSATTDWPTNTTFCTSGSSAPASPTFPSLGGTTSWTCNGLNAGDDVTCQANRNPESEKNNDDDNNCKGEIGNYVWLDSDGDGIQDDSENGLDGVHVKLTFDNKTYRTKTSSKGRYSFEDLCKGDYRVTVKDEDVAGYTQTYDPDDTKNNKTDVELKNDHDSHMSADFGYKGRRVAPATGSGTMTIYVSILLTLMTFITYRKIKNRRLALR